MKELLAICLHLLCASYSQGLSSAAADTNLGCHHQ